jgi:hypothetical protein
MKVVHVLMMICLLFVAVTMSTTTSAQTRLWASGPNLYIDKLNVTSSKHNVTKTTAYTGDLASLRQFLASVTTNNSAAEKIFAGYQLDKLTVQLHQHLPSLAAHQALAFTALKTVSSFASLRQTDYFMAGMIRVVNNQLEIVIGDHDRERDYATETTHRIQKRGDVIYNFDHGSFAAPTVITKKTMPATQQVPEKAIVAPTEPAATHAEQPKTLTERFQLLNELHRQGLISDEEFAAKKQALLDEI